MSVFDSVISLNPSSKYSSLLHVSLIAICWLAKVHNWSIVSVSGLSNSLGLSQFGIDLMKKRFICSFFLFSDISRADSLAAASLSNLRASESPPPAAATTISGAGYALFASVLNFTKKFFTVSVFGLNFWFSNFIILISLKSSCVNLFLRAVILSSKTSLVAPGRVRKYLKESPYKCNCRKFACCAAAIAATPIVPVINCSNLLKLSVSDPEKGVMLICACAIFLFTRLDYILIVQFSF